MKSAYRLLLFVVFISGSVFAQQSVSIGTTTLDNDAVLFLVGDGSQGLIIPRTSSITTMPVKEGMVVYNNTDRKVYYCDGSNWQAVGGGGSSGTGQTLTLNGNTISISGGNTIQLASAPAANSFFMWNGSSWVATSLTGDISSAAGNVTVNAVKGKAIPALPASTQALVYDGNNWVFQALNSGLSTTLSSGSIYVGNNSNTATAVAMSGDATMTNTGAVTIVNNAITTGKIADGTITASDLGTMGATTAGQVLRWNGSAWAPGVTSGLSSTLNAGQIYVGNATNIGTAVTMSGDGTLSNTGALTLANSGVTASTYGSGTQVPQLTVDSKGRITSALNVPIPTATAGTSGLLSAADFTTFTNKVSSVSAGTGIALGGTATAPTVGLNTTGVIANTYGSATQVPQLTVDAQGRITGVTNVTIAGATFGNLTTATTGVNITGGTGAVAGSGAVINIQNATTSQPGLLTAADWNTFNNKGSGTVTTVTGTGPISVINNTTTPAISISQAGAGNDGYLSSADFTIFNNKVSSVSPGTGIAVGGTATAPTVGLNTTGVTANTYGSATQVPQFTVDAQGRITGVTNVTIAGGTFGNLTSTTTGVNITGGMGAVVGSGATVDIQNATASQPGLLTAADFTTFNNKLGTTSSPTGGDVTGTFGTGLQLNANSVTTTEIADGSITAAKLSTSGAATGNILKYNGSNWVLATDDVGGGTVPTLSPTQVLIGDGTSNSATALSGDATINAGVLTLANSAATRTNLGLGGLATQSAVDLTTSSALGTLPISKGGTGITTTPANGQLLIGNGVGYTTSILTAGTNISITNGAGSITINANGLANPMTTQGDIIYGGVGGTPTALVAGTGFLRGGATPTYSPIGLATSDVTGALPVANGGTNLTTYAAGDILYASAPNVLSKLAIGTNGQVLTITGGLPTWASGGSGWDLSGNLGTVDGTNFIGTGDNVPLNFRVNGQRAGRVDNSVNNNYFGYLAGNTGENNTAVGGSALSSVTSGEYNTAIGNFALQSNTTGIENMAGGSSALEANLAGSNNSALGFYALRNSNANFNSAVGHSAGLTLTSGMQNTLLGANADVLINSLTKATAIGYNAKVGTSNSLVLGGTGVDAVNVGIGLTTPLSTLHLSGGSSQGLIRISNTAMGNTATDGLELSMDNSGVSRLMSRESGLMILGFGSNDVLHINSGGQVGINVVSPAATLDIGGNIKISGGAPDVGKVLTSDATGLATWQTPSGVGWGLTGNAGTTAGTNFIGTTDAQDLVFKTGTPGGIERMRIGGTPSAAGNLLNVTNNGFGTGLRVESSGVGTTMTAMYGLSNNATSSIGVAGEAISSGTTTVGLWGNAQSSGTSGTAYGVLAGATGTSTSVQSIAVSGFATGAGINKAIRGSASGGTENWAGFFEGDVHASGNVGIGTTTPAQALDVTGYVRVAAGTGASNEGLLLATPAAGTSLISAGGRATTMFTISQTNNAPMNFLTNGLERMRIDGAGNVGIGQTIPSQRLDVNGSINLGSPTAELTSANTGANVNLAPVAYFHITGSAGGAAINTSTTNVTGAVRFGTGVYDITISGHDFTNVLTTGGYIVTGNVMGAANGQISFTNNGTSLRVQTYSGAGAATDKTFSVVIYKL